MGAICGIIATARFDIRSPTPTSKGIETKTCQLTVNQRIRVTTAQSPATITYERVRGYGRAKFWGLVNRYFDVLVMGTSLSADVASDPDSSQAPFDGS